jgi:hypothetical protein
VFDKGDTLITEDNIEASKRRYEAIKAVKEGRATPEQRRMLEDLDKVMNEARRNNG